MSDGEQGRMRAGDLAALAKALRDSGDRAGALSAYQAAAEAWSGIDKVRFAHAARHAGDVARELGQLDVADRHIADALLVYREHDVGSLELANTLRVSALIKQSQGKPDQAKTIWRQARRLYEVAGVVSGVQEADARIAELP